MCNVVWRAPAQTVSQVVHSGLHEWISECEELLPATPRISIREFAGQTTHADNRGEQEQVREFEWITTETEKIGEEIKNRRFALVVNTYSSRQQIRHFAALFRKNGEPVQIPLNLMQIVF